MKGGFNMQQNQNTPISEDIIRTGGYNAVIRTASSPASVVLISAMSVLSFFFMVRMIISAATSKADALLASLYYFCGKENSMMINLIAASPLLLFFLFSTFSLIFISSSAKKAGNSEIQSNFKLFSAAMVFGLFLFLIYTVVGLCSVSVMYQSYRLDPNSEYAFFDGMTHSSLFLIVIVFSTVFIACAAGYLRFSNTLKKASSGTAVSSAGCVFSLVASSIAAISSLLLFFSSLVRLVMPEGTETITLSIVGSAAVDVLITASLTTVFSAAIFLIASYYSESSSLTRMSSYNYIYQFATNNFPRRYSSPTGTPPVIKGNKSSDEKKETDSESSSETNDKTSAK